jgi:hypothetical protein
MAFTPSMQGDFKASCITVAVTLGAYVVLRQLRLRSKTPIVR